MTVSQSPTSLVIALNCSGGAVKQWSQLTEMLGADYTLKCPEHYGSSWHTWHGRGAFSIADEAERGIALIDAAPSTRIHLVAHSYGGAVALQIALSRPDCVASLSLYEPSAFHLLQELHGEAAEALAEVKRVARGVCQGTLTGDADKAMMQFVDYWNAPGTWAAMRAPAQEALRCWSAKCPLEFHALLSDTTPISAYRRLDIPTLVLRGERTRAPSRLICEGLSEILPRAELVVVPDAGHMGPVTHAIAVFERIAAHIADVEGRGVTALLRRPASGGAASTHTWARRG